MNLTGEFRYAARSLAKSPVFTCVAVLSLALGIGANTAVYTLLDQVLLHMLPVQEPERLVQLKELGEHYGSNNGMNALSYPIYQDFRDQNQVFSGMYSSSNTQLSVSFDGRNERASGELVSGTYFDVLGLRPAAGRLFGLDEDRAPGGSPLAVLSYDYWKTRFANDPSIIGKQLLVNNHKLTVIGVAAKDYQGILSMFATQIFIPMTMAPQIRDDAKLLENRRLRWVQIFGRLKPGVNLTQAKASLQPIFHHVLEMEVQQADFARTSPYTRQQFLKMTLEVMPGGRGQDVVRQFMEAPLLALMGMVALVLLIACANVANLMIARCAARQKEIAVRLSLGASRLGIVRQLLIESGILAVLGGVLALPISTGTMRLLAAIMPEIDPPLQFVTDPNMRVLVFSLAISLFTAVVFGLLPALQATRPNLAPTLKDEATAAAGGSQARWRKLLVGAQISLSLLLLIGAGLFVRSLRNLKDLNPGFEVGDLVSFSVDPALSGYNTERSNLFYRQLKENLGALPNVRAAGLCVVPPLSFSESDTFVTVEHYTTKQGENVNPWVNWVSPGFFETLKIPVYAGRDFTDRDRSGAPKVAIVNEKFAHRYFGEHGAIGRHLGMGADPGTKTDIEIIGVVRDTKYMWMREEAPQEVFFPYLQTDSVGPMTAFVRTGMGSAQIFPILRGAVRKMDANLPVYQMKTEERQVNDSLAVERMAASLSGAFGILATVLAAVGLYGVMAFLVARRTREIGIRMALGAVTGDVIWLVMREVLLLVGIGIVIGLPAALAVTRLLASQLYGVGANDPATITFAMFGIGAIAALSGYLPARRATRVDPIRALRYE
jgi:predicted permease